MSEFTRLTAVAFFGAIGFVSIYYLAKITNEICDQVLSGFVGDHSIAIKDRWLILYNRLVPAVFGVVCLAAFLGFASWSMGSLADDPKTKLLAYFGAFLSAVAGVTWLGNAVSMVLTCRARLRQTEAN